MTILLGYQKPKCFFSETKNQLRIRAVLRNAKTVMQQAWAGMVHLVAKPAGRNKSRDICRSGSVVTESGVVQDSR